MTMKLLRKLSKIVSNVFPRPVANIMEIRNPITHNAVVTFFLSIRNLLLIPRVIGSKRERVVVIPANKTHMKNKGPII